MSENVKKAYAVVVYEQISEETKLKNYMDIAPKTFENSERNFSLEVIQPL